MHSGIQGGGASNSWEAKGYGAVVKASQGSGSQVASGGTFLTKQEVWATWKRMLVPADFTSAL